MVAVNILQQLARTTRRPGAQTVRWRFQQLCTSTNRGRA